jgi:hypothetical protein
MSDNRLSFIEQALSGKALIDEIDDFVEAWHSSDDSRSLAEFLGMSDDEYSLWVSNPGYLSLILAARHRSIPLRDAVNDNYLPALRSAARSDRAAKLDQLQHWLADHR